MIAGFRLGAVAFLLGMMLGPLRELLLAPLLGGMAAALLEAAVMVAGLWWVAGAALRPPPPVPWIAGVVAVAVVLAAEMLLGAGFDATGLSAQRAPRGLAEQAVGLLPLAWLGVLPLLRGRAG